MGRLQFSLFLALILFSCGEKNGKQTAEFSSDSIMKIECAGGFKIRYEKDFKTVEVFSQDRKNVLNRYYLVKNEETAVPADGVKLKIPLTKIASSSNTHLEFLQILGELPTLSGVCSPELIFADTVRSLVENGKIANLGDAFNLNIERLIFLRPQAIFVSGYGGGQKDEHQKIVQTGVPVICNNEWMEQTLLGRAEWVKFMAAFFDKESAAEEFFSAMKTRYDSLSALATATEKKPRVLLGGAFKGTWYMSSGRGFMADLVSAAGGDYFYANDSTTGSLPLSFEVVLKNFHDADVWLGAPSENFAQLLATDERYALFAPVKSGAVYNFSKRTKSGGANDFWESGVARADLILQDVLKILHPEKFENYELFYSKKLTEK